MGVLSPLGISSLDQVDSGRQWALFPIDLVAKGELEWVVLRMEALVLMAQIR